MEYYCYEGGAFYGDSVSAVGGVEGVAATDDGEGGRWGGGERGVWECEWGGGGGGDDAVGCAEDEDDVGEGEGGEWGYVDEDCEGEWAGGVF